MALVADGVAIQEVYQVMSTRVGIDRAFNALDRIKNDVVFWSSGASPLEMVSNGTLSTATGYNGRIGAAMLTTNENYVYLWDETLEDTFGGMALLARHGFVSFNITINNMGEAIKLGTLGCGCTPVTWRFTELQHLGHCLSIDTKLTSSLSDTQAIAMTRNPHSSIYISTV
jgi:hypothetical protein